MKNDIIISFKRGFEDTKTAIVGIILYFIIIIINGILKFYSSFWFLIFSGFLMVFLSLILNGFVVENIHNVLKKKKLPKFDKISKKFAHGIFYSLIMIIYELIPLFGIMIGLFFRNVALIFSSLILMLIFIPFAVFGSINYSYRFKFKDAFSPVVFKNAYRWSFIKYLIVGYLISVGLAIVLTISLVGIIFEGWIISIFESTFFALGYKKLKIKLRG